MLLQKFLHFRLFLFIYLFIIDFVNRQGCTKGQACKCTPRAQTDTYMHKETLQLHAWTKQRTVQNL